jgi:tetratricopeptide (TPR) repeat protein
MEHVNNGLTALFALLSVPLLVIIFFFFKFIYQQTLGRQMKTTLKEDYQKEADGHEKAGRFVSAAHVYQTKLKDPKKAAALYEKGGDFRQAALLYDLLDISSKAKEMYEKDGNIQDAAEVSIRDGKFEEAARLYSEAGQKIDEAVTMELAGRMLPAIRAYREAGDYKNAARLLEAEGMMKEAAEMFGFTLRDKLLDRSTVEDFYAYASKLEIAGQTDQALEVYIQLDRTDSTYRDVREKILALSPVEQDDMREMKGKTSVRSFIKSGITEPKYSFKLWFQILRSLQEAHNEGRPCGFMCPENILVDTHNNISFLKKASSSVYLAPEKTKGLEIDARADIFSMGVILYEMLTGNLDGLGSVRVTDIARDVPEWLDEIVTSCIRKVREDRYQSIEEIITDIRNLSKTKKDGE